MILRSFPNTNHSMFLWPLKYLQETPFLPPFLGSTLLLHSQLLSFPLLVSPQLMYDQSLHQSNGDVAYGWHLAVPLCCFLLVTLLHSGASPPQWMDAVNVAFPNHQLIEDSVLQTPWDGHSLPAAGSGLLHVVALHPVLGAMHPSIRRIPQDAQWLGGLHWPLSQCPWLSVKVLSTFQD